jgi:phosphoribosylanthranilate isomerase
VLIKICGCRDPQEVESAVAAGASAIGVVLVPQARRAVTPQQARCIIAAVPSGVLRVGVFRGQSAAEVEELGMRAGLDAVQLHDEEQTADCSRLRRRFLVLRRWNGEGPPPEDADWIVAEPRGGGGTGKAWDWSSALGLRERAGRPMLLAGGLTPENVADAVACARPDAVDVSSGVEVDGRKDPMRIGAFCAAVRGWRDVGANAWRDH